MSKSDFVEFGVRREKARERCFTEAGLKYTAQPVDFIVFPRYLDFPFSQREEQERRKTGYGIVAQQLSNVPVEKDPNIVYRNALSSDDKRLFDELYGIVPSPKRCKGETHMPDPTGAGKRGSNVRDLFIQNGRVQEINVIWKRCMKTSGFTAGSFWDPAKDATAYVPQRTMSEPASEALQEELKFANADVDCLSADLDELNKIRVTIEAQILASPTT
jgi:hypothetical protein